MTEGFTIAWRATTKTFYHSVASHNQTALTAEVAEDAEVAEVTKVVDVY